MRGRRSRARAGRRGTVRTRRRAGRGRQRGSAGHIERKDQMSADAVASGPKEPGWGSRALVVLQRIGKSLMMPVATLPAAALLVRFGQDDMLGRFHVRILQNIAAVMVAGGNSLLSNLPLIFAVGVAIGYAKKSDGSTALAAVIGYLVYNAVSMQMFAGSKLKAPGPVRRGRRPRPGRDPRRPLRRPEVRPGPDQEQPHRGARRHPGRHHRRAAVAALLPDQAAHLAGVLRRPPLRPDHHRRGLPASGRPDGLGLVADRHRHQPPQQVGRAEQHRWAPSSSARPTARSSRSGCTTC